MHPSQFQHPKFTRRTAIQAGAVGLLGLGMNHLSVLRAKESTDRAVIYIFLSGGLAQQDSFDLKPDAPAEIRGEFKPIATRTPGMMICEHLPKLAERSNRFALVRSLTHHSNDHSAGHQMMLSGRSELPAGFNPNAPRPQDWPSIAAVVGYATRPRNNLPPAAILPEKLVHFSGRVIPGAFAGQMGHHRDPWLIEASAYEPRAYGAYPEYEFDHQQRTYKPQRTVFQAPNLSLPEGLGAGQLRGRLDLLRHIDELRRGLERVESVATFDRFHQGAVSLLTQQQVRQAFDVVHA